MSLLSRPPGAPRDSTGGAEKAVEAAHLAIQQWFAASRQPVLIEPGEPRIAITPDNFEIILQDGRLTIQAWDRERNLLRKVLRVIQEKPGLLDLETQRFGKHNGKLQLIDAAAPQTVSASKKGSRVAYREVLRRSLARQFAGWEIRELSTEPDLQHSLSTVYPRAFLTKGGSAWAAIGAAPENEDPSGILSFGLIWLDYVRRRERKLKVEGLAIFLPDGRQRTTCLRALYLNHDLVDLAVFAYADGFERRLDLKDYGNLETKLQPRVSQFRTTRSQNDDSIERLARTPGVEAIECGDGALSLRVRGLEFARRTGDGFHFGLETNNPVRASNLGELQNLALQLSERRAHGAADRQSSLYQRSPELWLESQVRASITRIDAGLYIEPLYGQVPAFAGGERGVIDLLAADVTGRLAVIELKASEDIHLPLQALDYWMRVSWHAERGEFTSNGYFPGIALTKAAPRLLLVAPSLEFHPSTETLLRYFSPAIEVERIGLTMDWRREVQTMFRMKGAESRA
jgi:hypothetical protein